MGLFGTVALLLCLVWGGAAVATTMPTETMVVTAKRLLSHDEHLGGSVSVITAEQIQRRTYRVLSDALRDVPGLSVSQSGGIGAQTSVFMRGSESDHVLVLIDGIEVSDPSAGNRYEFSQLSLNGIERIEVLRGNYSAEYGSEALGGVINIITRTASQNEMKAQIEIGSFERRSATVDIDAIYKALNFSLSSRYFETRGESVTPARIRRLDNCAVGGERDGYRNSDIKMNADLLLIPKTNTNLAIKSEYSQTDLEYDADRYNELTFALECSENPYSWQSSYTKRTSALLSGDYFDGMWSPTWRIDHYARDSHYRDTPDTARSENEGERFRFNWHNVWRPSLDWDMALGIETELEKARENGGFDADTRGRAFYAKLNYALTPNWYLNGSWRNDDSDDFASEQSYRVGSVLHANLNTRLHLNYATAFRAPSLLDRFRNFPEFNFLANPKLNPETGRSWEIGLEQNWLQWRYGLTYFNNEIKDLIDYVFDPSNFSSTLINQDRAHIRGLDSFVAFQPHKNFSIQLDYTLLSAHDQSGQRLLRRPVRQALLLFDYHPVEGVYSDWTLNMTLNYTGPQSDVNRITFARVAKGGYALLSLNLTYEVNDRLHFYGSVNNLLDKSYEAVNGFKSSGLNAHIGLSLR